MNKTLQSSTAPTQQADRRTDGPLRLSECGDTLTVTELCRVLQISRSHYYELTRHRAFPIGPIRALGVARYAKTAVEAFLRKGV